MINVLLIGLGGLGLRHAQSLIADEKVNLFIYEKSEEVLRKNLKQIEDQSRVKILNNIKRKFKDKILILVSSRISTIFTFDKIVVLDSGKIVQFGNSSLLENEVGLFRDLMLTQKNSLYLKLINI